MLDGASRIKDLISFAKEQGMPALALTDHGVMYGAVKFYKEAKGAGIIGLLELPVLDLGAERAVRDQDALGGLGQQFLACSHRIT